MNKFYPYQPPYTLADTVVRAGTLLKASAFATWKLISRGSGFAASVEITDRCNAGCHYCYVYPSRWN